MIFSLRNFASQNFLTRKSFNHKSKGNFISLNMPSCKKYIYCLIFCHIIKKVDFRRWLIRYLNERQKLKCVTNHAMKNISYCICQNRKNDARFRKMRLMLHCNTMTFFISKKFGLTSSVSHTCHGNMHHSSLKQQDRRV